MLPKLIASAFIATYVFIQGTLVDAQIQDANSSFLFQNHTVDAGLSGSDTGTMLRGATGRIPTNPQQSVPTVLVAESTQSPDDAVIGMAKTYLSNYDIQKAAVYTSGGYVTEQASENDFIVKDVIYDVDANGNNIMAHVRLDRYYNGLRVIGGDAVVHINTIESSLLDISQTLDKPIKVSTDEVASMQVMESSSTSRELVIYTFYDDEPTLAWDVVKSGIAADGTPMVVHYILDASNGKELTKFSDTMSFMATGWPGIPLANEVEGAPLSALNELVINPACPATPAISSTGKGSTMYSGVKDLSTTKINDAYQLWDNEDRNCHFTVYYCGNTNSQPPGTQMQTCNHDVSDVFPTTTDDIWGDTTIANPNTAAADAHYGFGATFDFFKKTFNRNGVFDDGRTGVHSRVHAYHCNQNVCGPNNAFWDGIAMNYGDGDGKVYFKPLVSLDIAAHELTHGVTDATAKLKYASESGGLNEATSDIMAVLTDFFTNGDAGNYLIGEQVFLLKPFLRSMIQPSDDGVSYDCYCSPVQTVDVHLSSGVANHFFYLLTEGTTGGNPSRTCNPNDCREATKSGTLSGIGRDKAGQIWYRALTTCFGENTNYKMAATCTIQAAKDLYTTMEAQAVRNAWIAVNVEVPITSVPSKKPPLKPSSSTLKPQKRAKQKKATKKQAPMDSVSTGNVLGVINSTSMNSTQMPLNLTQLVDAAGLPTLPIEKTSASLTTTSTYYASSSTNSTYASTSTTVRNVTEGTDLF